jgi:hypothetical protein
MCTKACPTCVDHVSRSLCCSDREASGNRNGVVDITGFVQPVDSIGQEWVRSQRDTEHHGVSAHIAIHGLHETGGIAVPGTHGTILRARGDTCCVCFQEVPLVGSGSQE